MMTLLAVRIAQEVVERGEGISSGALAFMLITMAMVIALVVWCFVRILTTKEHFDPDGTGPAHPPVPGREDVG